MKETELTRCDAKPDVNSAFALAIVASKEFAEFIGIQASRTLVIIFNAVACFVNIPLEQMLAVQIWFRNAANAFGVFGSAF